MPGLGLGEHPLCAWPCNGWCRLEVYKPSYQSITEQVRVGQPRGASGACKAFWDDLDIPVPGALARVTVLLFITRFPNGRSNQCDRRYGETPKRLTKASVARDSVPVGSGQRGGD